MAHHRSVRRTVAGGVLAWAVTLGGLRLFVVQPEHCGDTSTEAITVAAQEAVDWLVANQRPDGTWRYRYDRNAGADVAGYNIVRHAGVALSLEQAATRGFVGAADASERGLAWALGRLRDGPGWRALGEEGARVRVGASALLVAGLVERRGRTGDPVHDADLHALGRFLLQMVTDRGEVHGLWDPATGRPVPGSWSKYFTGEAFWALALLDGQFPDQGYDVAAGRIADYLATERDDAEGWWPDVADHWAAYGFAATVAAGGGLDPDHVTYARRQAGMQSLQIRYESQRTDGWLSHLTRGRPTLGAGLGTIGEALAAWTTVAASTPELDDVRTALTERNRCVAGLLAARQVGADDSEDPREIGAWFQFDVTQMDDQQHALSALLGALDLAAVGS